MNAALEEKSKNIQKMFDSISGRYDFLNTLLSFKQDSYWRRVAINLADIKSGNRVLDLATGTAETMAKIIKKHPDVDIIGADFSIDMLKIAKTKQPANTFLAADAHYIPFRNNSFDRVITSFGFRNVTDKFLCLTELKRILKNDGKIIILELSEPENFILSRLYRLYFSHILPFIGKRVSGDNNAYSYLPDSVYKFQKRKEYEQLIRSAGFNNVSFKTLTFGIVTIAIIEK